MLNLKIEDAAQRLAIFSIHHFILAFEFFASSFVDIVQNLGRRTRFLLVAAERQTRICAKAAKTPRAWGGLWPQPKLERRFDHVRPGKRTGFKTKASPADYGEGVDKVLHPIPGATP
jgi:hypothetical protein